MAYTGWSAVKPSAFPKLKPTGKRTIPKGTRPTPPKKLGGTRPNPLVVKPITPGKPITPPTPPRPDFNNWYKTDPRYLLQSPILQAGRIGTYAQYGMYPITDAAGKPVLDAKGNPTYRTAGAGEAPFSIMNQLAQALAGNSQNVADTANSRGLLFSGAQVQGQQNAKTAYDSQVSDATLAFGRALSGINTDEMDLVNSLYPDYLATAPPAGPAAAKPTPAKPTASAAAKAEADRKARVKKAQDHLRQDRIDAARRKKLKKRPPKKTTGAKLRDGGIAGGM